MPERTKTQLLRFNGSVKQDPTIETWLKAQPDDMGTIAQHRFEVIRQCGNGNDAGARDDYRELLHDGHSTACVTDAAFAYVNVFKAHVNVGVFRGTELSDPEGLLEDTGKLMRHVKLKPDGAVDVTALTELIDTAYVDMRERVAVEMVMEA